MTLTPLWLWLRGCVLGVRELRQEGPRFLVGGVRWVLVILILTWPIVAVYAADRLGLLPAVLDAVLVAFFAFLVWLYGAIVPYLAGKEDAEDVGVL